MINFLNSKYLLISIILLSSLIIYLSVPLLAQEGDAIGIQVRANPDRYSALRWYTDVKHFEGAPQSLMVDGYEAVRDGRTVYVNAGNFDNNNFYSNIYLISYSQAAFPRTIDVFADMLKHWTFNTNLINPGDDGLCAISTILCHSDDDCQEGYNCHPDNKCHLNDEANFSCWRDSDCPSNIYCNSAKARITRRTKRYANLADIRTEIINFEKTKGSFPALLAGTYIPGISLSTWPSWNNTLAAEVNGGVFPVDPLNIMGDCGGNNYDMRTCWDDVAHTYGGNITANRVLGPGGSYFYGYNIDEVYSFSPDGTIFCPLDGSACH